MMQSLLMNPSQKTIKVCKNKLLDLLAKDAYRHGNFILASGKNSSHYVNCKPVSLSGEGLDLISRLLLDFVDPDACSVAGLTLGADPLVSGVAMAASYLGRSLNALIVRKEAKGHGTGAWLEGPLPPKGSVVTVLEDVVTTGGSSIKAVNRLREVGYEVKRVVTIVDRQEGAELAMKDAGLQLDSLFLLNDVAIRSQDLLR
tara:strand:- start:1398 stop:2000 length:603 start_codon:yes stop_codon:yes gene_type:complete